MSAGLKSFSASPSGISNPEGKREKQHKYIAMALTRKVCVTKFIFHSHDNLYMIKWIQPKIIQEMGFKCKLFKLKNNTENG